MSETDLTETTSSTSIEKDSELKFLPPKLHQLPTTSGGLADIFSKTHVLTRPMLAIKDAKSPEVCIAVFNLEDFETTDYICRICHGSDSDEELLTPCKCRGTIALAHLKCLETWLSESNRNDCELCQYHYRVIREPKYGVLRSIFVFLRHPGEHYKDLMIDFITFVIYTPSTITSTYMLLLLCESVAKSEMRMKRTFLSHAMVFTAVFGIAAINFTYTSWLALCLEKYFMIWRDWYKRNSSLRVVLSNSKIIPIRNKR